MPTMTKAQLVDENIRLRAHAAALEQRIASLKEKLAQTDAVLDVATKQLSQTTKPQAATFDTYTAYVQACRAWCRRANKPVSYLTRDDWLEAHYEAHGSEANYA